MLTVTFSLSLCRRDVSGANSSRFGHMIDMRLLFQS